MNRRGQHSGSSSLRSVGLKTHTKLTQKILSIRENIHQVTDWGTLITADITDTILQKRFGYSQDAFAREHVAIPFAQVLNFFFKRAFSHFFSFDFQFLVSYFVSAHID